MYQGSAELKITLSTLLLQYWPYGPVLMRTKGIEMCTGQVWSGVAHEARAAVLYHELCHERAAASVKANLKSPPQIEGFCFMIMSRSRMKSCLPKILVKRSAELSLVSTCTGRRMFLSRRVCTHFCRTSMCLSLVL